MRRTYRELSKPKSVRSVISFLETMDPNKPLDVTQMVSILRHAGEDRPEITSRVFEALYQELRGLAGGLLRPERSGHTLRPTALVHEAFSRLVDQQSIDWQGRAHFMAIAGRTMRRVLVDHARKHGARKRGGGLNRVTLTDALSTGDQELELLELDHALTKLADKSERAAQVAELKVFGGLSGEEISEALGVSRRTVTGDWTFARMWLARELSAQ